MQQARREAPFLWGSGGGRTAVSFRRLLNQQIAQTTQGGSSPLHLVNGFAKQDILNSMTRAAEKLGLRSVSIPSRKNRPATTPIFTVIDFEFFEFSFKAEDWRAVSLPSLRVAGLPNGITRSLLDSLLREKYRYYAHSL